MMSLSTATSLLIILGLIPLLWSGAIWGLRQLTDKADAPLHDTDEKRALFILLAPIAIGTLLLVAAQFTSFRTPIPLPIIDTLHSTSPTTGQPGEPLTSPQQTDWPALAFLALTLAYAAGLARAALRLLSASRQLRQTVRSARPTPAADTTILLSETDLPPFATSRGQIILPAQLIKKAPQPHLDLIIAHERAHIARGDARYFLTLAWIDAVLWFNPFMRAQTARCRLAAELACDAEVISQKPEMRRTYADAIVSALKHAAGNALPCAPAAFSTRKHGEYRMRIASIMQGDDLPRKQRKAVTIAALIAAAPLAAAQMAYAFDTPDNAPAFVGSVVDGKVSSKYGQRRDPFTDEIRFHNGVDIAAPAGTTVQAAAAGTITRAGRESGYGFMVEIDHGAGYVTRYGHLGNFQVELGDKVAAGQTIAEVGQTDRTSTGAHVHLELYQDGELIDPASVMTLPAKKD